MKEVVVVGTAYSLIRMPRNVKFAFILQSDYFFQARLISTKQKLHKKVEDLDTSWGEINMKQV